MTGALVSRFGSAPVEPGVALNRIKGNVKPNSQKIFVVLIFHTFFL